MNTLSPEGSRPFDHHRPWRDCRALQGGLPGVIRRQRGRRDRVPQSCRPRPRRIDLAPRPRGLAGDIALDPTNYIGGVGFFDDIARAGLRRADDAARIVVPGIGQAGRSGARKADDLARGLGRLFRRTDDTFASRVVTDLSDPEIRAVAELITRRESVAAIEQFTFRQQVSRGIPLDGTFFGTNSTRAALLGGGSASQAGDAMARGWEQTLNEFAQREPERFLANPRSFETVDEVVRSSIATQQPGRLEGSSSRSGRIEFRQHGGFREAGAHPSDGRSCSVPARSDPRDSTKRWRCRRPPPASSTSENSPPEMCNAVSSNNRSWT